MATSEILGLFQTPDQYAAGQDAAMQRQFLQRASLDPFQKASVSAQQAGYSLGQGIGGALGGTDPQLEMISRRNVLLGQLNPSDPKSYSKVAEAAAKMGDSQFAVLIAQEGRKAASEEALARQRDAAAGKERQQATPTDIQIADKIANLRIGITRLEALPASPERDETKNLLTYQLTELERLSDKTKTGTEKTPVKIGVAKGTEQVVYFDPSKDEQFVLTIDKDGKQIRKAYTGSVDTKTASVTATASSKGADEGSKTIAELGAKRVDAANVSAGKAIEQAGLLQELLKTPQPISGSGAPARVGALRVFSTFGLTSSKDDEALGNADKFNALAGERVISFIKALGSNPTDTDREFARTIGPALEKGTKTNTDLINFLLERARKVVKDASDMETHFYNNNYSLRGYKSPFLTDLETPKSKTSNMSAEDLAKAAGGKIVNGKFVKD
jgi:hypothetical protein